MIDMEYLMRVYAEKLLKTGSHDEAIKKVAWVSFKHGVTVGSKSVSL